MRISSLLQTSAVLVLAVVAGLLGASGTWALWNASATTDAGAVHAASLVVAVDGADMIVDDTSTTVALANPSAALTPKTPVFASLTLTNSTDASSRFTIGATLGTPQVRSKNSALASTLTVQSARMPAGGDCSTAAYPDGASAQVGKGGTQRFCLRMSLPKNAPDSLVNSAATVTIPVHVEQIR